jgi:serine/threonine-protein kinase ULK/ATG1
MNFNMQAGRQPGSDLRKKIEDYSYGLSDVIGKGYSSLVFKGINEKTREIVAIKVIDVKAFKDRIGKQMLEGEIEALRKLNHVNILKCYDVYSTVNNCYIITEFCTEGDTIPVFRDIYKGFKYLANRGFLHRDLKPANIFIKDGMYKIADFGFAKRDSGFTRK